MQILFFNNVNILVRHDCQIEKAVYGIVMLFPVKYQWFATAHNISILFYKNKNKIFQTFILMKSFAKHIIFVSLRDIPSKVKMSDVKGHDS